MSRKLDSCIYVRIRDWYQADENCHILIKTCLRQAWRLLTTWVFHRVFMVIAWNVFAIFKVWRFVFHFYIQYRWFSINNHSFNECLNLQQYWMSCSYDQPSHWWCHRVLESRSCNVETFPTGFQPAKSIGKSAGSCKPESQEDFIQCPPIPFFTTATRTAIAKWCSCVIFQLMPLSFNHGVSGFN